VPIFIVHLCAQLVYFLTSSTYISFRQSTFMLRLPLLPLRPLRKPVKNPRLVHCKEAKAQRIKLPKRPDILTRDPNWKHVTMWPANTPVTNCTYCSKPATCIVHDLRGCSPCCKYHAEWLALKPAVRGHLTQCVELKERQRRVGNKRW